MALTQVTGPYPIFTDLDGTPLDDGYLYIGEVNQDPEQNPIQVYWDSNLTIAASQPIRTSNGYAYRNGTPALIYTGGEFSITIRNKREEFVVYSPVGYGFDPGAVSGSVTKNDFIGDGVEVDFVLSVAPSTILATNVFINGVYQEKDSYSILGNVLTFSIAPPLSSSIEVLTNQTGIINTGYASDITYTAGFPGATAQTVQTKLEQTVSVKDFGAVGDGVTDDTAAITAAFTYANSLKRTGLVATIQHPGCTVVFSGGTYNVSSISTSFLVECNVQSDGAGILVPAAYAGTVFTVGLTNSGDLLSTADITLPDVYKPTLSSIVAGSTGVRIANINASVVRFGRIDYFARAMHFGGIGQGSVYCDFFLGQTSYADVIIYIIPGSGGWCNANNFYGGNFRLGGARVSGQYHILMDGTAPATAIVGNNFIGTSLEGNGAIYVVYAKNAYGNTFNGIYNETQPALKSVTVSGDTLTSVGHGLPVGSMLTFIAAVVPTGMFELTPYYVVAAPTADTFKVSRNKGGTAVTFSSSGTSVQYYWQASCYFDGSGGANTYSNVFNDIFAPPSVLLDFVNVGQALNNGEQNVNLRTVRSFTPSDAPYFRAGNTSVTAATRTSFAAYPSSVDPVTQPTLWTAGISDQGVMFQTPGTDTESGRVTSQNGVLFYESLNDGTLAQVPSGFRPVAFTTLGTTSVPANGRAIATLTVTGTSVGDYVVPMISSALPDGIAIAWARASAANTVQIAFHNWTGAPIDIAGAQLKALVYRSVY